DARSNGSPSRTPVSPGAKDLGATAMMRGKAQRHVSSATNAASGDVGVVGGVNPSRRPGIRAHRCWPAGGWSEDDAPRAAGNLVGGPEAIGKTETERKGDPAESSLGRSLLQV